jgi:hypothetical protein
VYEDPLQPSFDRAEAGRLNTNEFVNVRGELLGHRYALGWRIIAPSFDAHRRNLVAYWVREFLRSFEGGIREIRRPRRLLLDQRHASGDCVSDPVRQIRRHILSRALRRQFDCDTALPQIRDDPSGGVTVFWPDRFSDLAHQSRKRLSEPLKASERDF